MLNNAFHERKRETDSNASPAMSFLDCTKATGPITILFNGRFFCLLHVIFILIKNITCHEINYVQANPHKTNSLLQKGIQLHIPPIKTRQCPPDSSK